MGLSPLLSFIPSSSFRYSSETNTSYLLSAESCHTILKTVLVGLVFLMVSRIRGYVVLDNGIRMCQLAWGRFNVRADLVSCH